MKHHALRILLLVLASLLAFAGWRIWVDRVEEPVPGQKLGGNTEGEPASADPLATPPRLVRILIEPPPDAAPATQSPREAQVFGEFAHAGELDPHVFRGTLANFGQLLANAERKARMLRGRGDLEEAEALWSLEMKRAAIEALKESSYITTAKTEDVPYAIIPGAETMITGGRVDGESVRLTIVMPFARFPALEAARKHLDLSRDVDDWKRAQAFNALPEAERMRLAAEIDALMRRPQLSSDELGYVWRTIGRTGELDAATGTVTLQRVR